MSVTLYAQLGLPAGDEFGARFYKRSAPSAQVGADVILSQSTPLSLYLSGAIEDLTLSTLYNVEYFVSVGGTIDTTQRLGGTSCYVGTDGGIYWLGSDAPMSVDSFTGAAKTQVDRIDANAQKISSGNLVVYGVAMPGGRILLKQGDDYTGDFAAAIDIADPGAILHSELTDAGVASIDFGAGRLTSRDQITGVVASTHNSGTTTLKVSITQDVTALAPARADYKYDIQFTLTSGVKRKTRVTGSLEVELDRKS